MATSSQTRVYSHAVITVSWNGLPITGFADGDDAVSVKFSADDFDQTVGVDGSVQFNRMVDETGEVGIKLHHTSPSNLDLRKALEESKRQGGNVLGQISISDPTTGDRWFAKDCVIVKAPDVQLGASASTQDWTIRAGHLKRTNANMSSIPDAPIENVSQVDPTGYFNASGGGFFG